MNYRYIILAICVSLATHGHASNTKELRGALKETYQVTKRSMMSGELKRAGTVFVVKDKGFRAIVEKLKMPKTIIQDGVLNPDSGPGPDVRGWPLRIGERLHLKGYMVHRDGATLLLATENVYDAGQPRPRPLRLNVQLKYTDGIDAVPTEQILSHISNFFPDEKTLAEYPDLQSAMTQVASVPLVAEAPVAAAAPVKQPSAARTASTNPKSGNSSRGAANGRKRYAGDDKQAISCEAANWEGVVTNIADLFECDMVRAIETLSKGSSVEIQVHDPEFSDGTFRTKMRKTPSWWYEFWDRVDGTGGMGEFNVKISLKSNRPDYHVTCQFPVAAMSDLKQGETRVVSATLVNYRDKLVTLTCAVS